jgi:CubicO group peptidase (beta-lactamase class C family)
VPLRDRLEKLPALLAERALAHGVPGAALAVAQADDVLEAACGVVNAATGVEATPDSVFQIGSITKMFTATQVMQLVDQGRIALDQPIWGALPELQLGDPEATTAITVRQLLTHTSGIDGDFFEDTGSGEDCVERYVLACRALPQLHPPGAMFSYCNAGFVILGRLIERLTGKTWDQALRDQILAPIGTEKMGTRPEQAILHRAAVGHMPDPKTGEPAVVPVWRLAASNGPAGATPFATARDLLRFARLHLDEGAAPNGERVLEAKTALRMRMREVELPEQSLASAWGLGFMLFDLGGTPAFGHDGGTIGQASFLRIVPGARVSFALLTNGGNAAGLYRDIANAVLRELCGVSLAPLPAPDPALRPDPALLVGRYERLSNRVEVEVNDGALRISSRGLRGMMRMLPAQQGVLEPVGPLAFSVRLDQPREPRPIVVFLDPDPASRPRYLLLGGRVNRRVS